MENETVKMEGESAAAMAADGVPEREPETIGDALKKYFEEQLTHGSARAQPARIMEFERLMAQHFMALN